MLGTLDAVSVSGYWADCAFWRILAHSAPTKAPDGLCDGFSLELVWSSARCCLFIPFMTV